MIRGEIWSVTLPSGTGREQSGQRPAIIVQDALYGQLSPLVLVVPLTSQLSALRFSATVQIAPSSQNGLALPSVALVFQTRATDRSRFVHRLGTLSPADLSAVLNELNKLTGQ
jgi:mRNA-degrading endonuclease toxin of MazEF toxin-antitoxin module